MEEPDTNTTNEGTASPSDADSGIQPDSTNALPDHQKLSSPEIKKSNPDLPDAPSTSTDTAQENISTNHDMPKATSTSAEVEESRTPDTNGDENNVIILDSDDEDDIYANPEPPRELVEGQLMNADTIGDTVFSKHWLFTTLMNLITAVDKEVEANEAEATDFGIDIDEALQDDLCKLWDMSMNQEVVTFLLEFKAVELLTGVIAKSKAPRATEICVGILGNMACQKTARSIISSSDKLRALVLLLLESPDAPTLVETTRLLYTCVSSASVCDLWMTSVKATPSVYDSLVFILQSSTNTDLLSHTADFMDKVMDTEDELLIKWSTVVAVQAILEAVKQCGSCKEAVDTFLHILQLVSTCEPGVEALGEHSLPVCQLTLQYLIQLCSEEIVILDGQENTVGSALSVLATAFTAVDDKSPFLVHDFQLMRCLLKILHVVYPKLRPFTPEVNRQRSRTDSRSSVIKEPKSRTSSGDKDKSDDHVMEEKTEDCSKESCDIEIIEEKTNVKVKEDGGVMEMLYEVLQNILTDVVLVISEEEAVDTETDSSSNHEDQSSEAPNHSNENHDNKPDLNPVTPAKLPRKSKKPQSLVYLNDLCERTRIRIMVHTLDEVLDDTELDCCARLRQVAQNHGFSRIESIVQEYSAG